MKRLTLPIRADREYDGFLTSLAEQYRKDLPLPIAVNGLSGGAEDAFLAESVIEASRLSDVPVLVLVGSESERERVVSLLSDTGLSVAAYKKRDPVFHNIRASHDVERERLSVLYSIACGECDVVVSTPSAASLYTIPKERLTSLVTFGRAGDVLPPEELVERLISLGYCRVDSAPGRGQFARRGGIIDFFGEGEYPVRVEFFGDEIDRLAYFDPITQRSISSCESFCLLPAAEVIVTKREREMMIAELDSLASACPVTEVKERLLRERAILLGDGSADFRDRYLGLIYPERENLFTYLSSAGRGIVMILGTSAVGEELKKHTEYLAAERSSMLSVGSVSLEAAFYTSGEEEYEKYIFANLSVHINAFSGGISSLALGGLFGFRSRRTVSYGDNPRMLTEDLSGFVKGMYRVLIVAESRVGAQSLASVLADAGFATVPVYDSPDFDITTAPGGRIFITVGRAVGYDLIAPKIAVLSMERDEGKRIMANRRRQRILRQSGGAGQRLMSYADLSEGDYVVHASYGIGLFEGIQSVTVDGITRDYITIKYAGTDKLFVPCDRLEQIGKYIGARDKDGSVKLSKMGGGDWQRTKTRAKNAARDIAKGLIALYAERQRQPGFAFPADSDLELDFADSFEYEETESQTTAIKEIKADMMRPVPMNRLLCGDVGFGKTEVALRAAFKAIMGGKQVAILVPTTILAMQHYETALSRMRNYPVTVEMLTRFKKPKEQAEILRKVRRGECDILIGTHKLLSKQLEFRELGLLIIDEEQRFGVAQKEKLKEMAKNVDCLTLTATPIPRTLNMAMNGISDISLLDEAPGERRPVQTYVLEHDDTIVFDAIAKELARGGQVLYLYNKIETIDLAAGKIVSAFPAARVAYAHGRMEKEELEDIWQMLVRGEIDVLVCTTIIETGVDLPSANTLIIENADRFGLAQLHQIRGRVGRSERQAYAYFTYRPGKALSEIAEKRLSAIKAYAEFGAGFKIALCDLEIRGAGNLLGAEQHGYIDSVGYDLYVKLLSEAVLEEKGEMPRERTEAHVDIKVNAHIPEKYIKTSAERMEMYKKISLILTPDDLSDVADELIDRFGDMPRPVARLLDVALIKALAERAGISRVEAGERGLVFHIGKPDLAMWSEVFSEFSGMHFSPSADRVMLRADKADYTSTARAVLECYYRASIENDSKEAERTNG